MSAVPMVKVGSVIIATLGDELDDADALAMQSSLGHRVVAERADGVLLDISALEIVDSFICKVLSDTAGVVRVLGARVAVVGMRPAVAITLVELGLPLPGVNTVLSIDHGLAALAAARRGEAAQDRLGRG